MKNTANTVTHLDIPAVRYMSWEAYADARGAAVNALKLRIYRHLAAGYVISETLGSCRVDWSAEGSRGYKPVNVEDTTHHLLCRFLGLGTALEFLAFSWELSEGKAI